MGLVGRRCSSSAALRSNHVGRRAETGKRLSGGGSPRGVPAPSECDAPEIAPGAGTLPSRTCRTCRERPRYPLHLRSTATSAWASLQRRFSLSEPSWSLSMARARRSSTPRFRSITWATAQTTLKHASTSCGSTGSRRFPASRRFGKGDVCESEFGRATTLQFHAGTTHRPSRALGRRERVARERPATWARADVLAETGVDTQS